MQRVRSRQATKRRRAGAARRTTRRRSKSLGACLVYVAEQAMCVLSVDSRRVCGRLAAPVARGGALMRFFARRRNQKCRVCTRWWAAAVADASVPRPRRDAFRGRPRSSRGAPRRGYPRRIPTGSGRRLPADARIRRFVHTREERFMRKIFLQRSFRARKPFPSRPLIGDRIALKRDFASQTSPVKHGKPRAKAVFRHAFTRTRNSPRERLSCRLYLFFQKADALHARRWCPVQ